jgi:hypothetical protein
LNEALKLTSAPIKASSGERGIEGKLPARSARRRAATFTTAGSIYLLNNLRDKLNEAIEDLFVEARTVVEELQRATLESGLSELAGVNKDATQISQARFTRIVKTIIAEGNNRRRKRLRKALWEIARGRGRPKGVRAPRESQRFSKSEFDAQLKQKIRGLSTRAFGLNRITMSAFKAPSVISTVSPGASSSLTKVKCIGVPELVPCRSSGDESQQYLFS